MIRYQITVLYITISVENLETGANTHESANSSTKIQLASKLKPNLNSYPLCLKVLIFKLSLQKTQFEDPMWDAFQSLGHHVHS